MTAQTYIRRSRQTLVELTARLRSHSGARGVLWGLGGFLCSAAGILNLPQPLSMGLICALSGWNALGAAVGSMLGYGVFWGPAGYPGMVWSAIGLILALIPRKRAGIEMLLTAAAGVCTGVTGLVFQIFFRGDTPFLGFLISVAVAMGSVWAIPRAFREDQPLYRQAAKGSALLALAQVAPLPWLSLGWLSAGFLTVREALPCVVLGGLALDIAGVTPVPMTAVLGLCVLLRQIPNKWLRATLPAAGFLLVMGLGGRVDWMPLPGLLAGGVVGVLLPGVQPARPYRGPVGQAQVRLELMAGVLGQTRQLLLETENPKIDTDALLARTRERACGGCPNRKQCPQPPLPSDSLSRNYTEGTGPGIPCKKPGRLLLELRRSQEQLRVLRGDQARREQYRQAAAQQYEFLAEFLRRQADELPRKEKPRRPAYQAEVGVCTAGKEPANGDKCLYFSGTGSRYYVLLCDGMGTGIGAEAEGKTASELLRQMLTAGFPAEYAIRSINSLCCLRRLAGAVTVDLAELCLSTGNVTLYKWGASPSWLLRRTGAEKIGTATPPPGLSVTDTRETVERLSLRRGEALILTSDGLNGEAVLGRLRLDPAEPPGEVAALLVEQGSQEIADDATAAVIRLRRTSLTAS